MPQKHDRLVPVPQSPHCLQPCARVVALRLPVARSLHLHHGSHRRGGVEYNDQPASLLLRRERVKLRRQLGEVVIGALRLVHAPANYGAVVSHRPSSHHVLSQFVDDHSGTGAVERVGCCGADPRLPPRKLGMIAPLHRQVDVHLFALRGRPFVHHLHSVAQRYPRPCLQLESWRQSVDGRAPQPLPLGRAGKAVGVKAHHGRQLALEPFMPQQPSVATHRLPDTPAAQCPPRLATARLHPPVGIHDADNSSPSRLSPSIPSAAVPLARRRALSLTETAIELTPPGGLAAPLPHFWLSHGSQQPLDGIVIHGRFASGRRRRPPASIDPALAATVPRPHRRLWLGAARPQPLQLPTPRGRCRPIVR